MIPTTFLLSLGDLPTLAPVLVAAVVVTGCVGFFLAGGSHYLKGVP